MFILYIFLYLCVGFVVNCLIERKVGHATRNKFIVYCNIILWPFIPLVIVVAVVDYLISPLLHKLRVKIRGFE